MTRILEIVPGALVWVTIVASIILSFVYPSPVIYFIILFDLYWLVKVFYFSFYLIMGWLRLRSSEKIVWKEKLEQITDKNYLEYFHLIFLPTYKEEYEVLHETFLSLLNTNYAKEKMIVVLAGEERDLIHFKEVANRIEQKFGSAFAKLLITTHPSNLPDEIPGKGSNINWAGHEVKKFIDEQGISYERIIVSTFDVDTRVHREYFGNLTYAFLTHKNPLRSSFQPIPLYHNNLWDSPGVLRVAAFGTTFWLLAELMRPERLFTFSSHSMSFKALVDVDFWQKDIVSEDSRIFLQCFFRYDGDYTVTPLFVPVYMNTPRSTSFWRSLRGLYLQQRRWAWGVENIPYMISRFWRNGKINIGKKFKYGFNLMEGMYSWATAPILIFILGRLPLYVAGQDFKNKALFANTPFTLEFLMTTAMMGVLFSAILSFFLLPKKPAKLPWWQNLSIVVQWVFLPVTLIIFGSLPAIDAQTRLMLGKKLGFTVSEKK